MSFLPMKSHRKLGFISIILAIAILHVQRKERKRSLNKISILNRLLSQRVLEILNGEPTYCRSKVWKNMGTLVEMICNLM